MERLASIVWISILISFGFSSEVMVPSIPSLSEMVNFEDLPDLRNVEDIRDLIIEIRNKANVLIAKSFAKHIRKQRDVHDLESLRISDSTPFTLPAVDAIKNRSGKISSYTILTKNNKTYLVLCGKRNASHVVVDYSDLGQELNILSEFRLNDDIAVDMVVGSLHENELWLALGSSSSRVVSIIRIDVSTGHSFLAPSIYLKGLLGALHMFQVDGQIYLVTGINQLEISSGSFESRLGLYVLLTNYFDVIDTLSLNTQNVMDISGFADGMTYNLVFALKYTEGPRIYQFKSGMHTLQLLQELQEKETMKVGYFSDLHDGNKYIIILSKGSAPKIYWWEREQFSLWQTLSSEPLELGASLGILVLENMEITIFVSNKGKIMFYSDDHSGHYHLAYTLETDCHSVRDLFAVETVDSIVFQYICLSEDGTAIDYKANMLLLLPVGRKDVQYPLLECVNTLNKKLEDRKEDVEAAESILPLIMAADSPQVWSTSLEFPQGLVVTGTTRFSSELVLQDHDNVHHEILELAKELEEVEETVKNASHLDSILYYSKDQNISALISTSSVTIERASMSTVQLRGVNGVILENLTREILMDSIPQTIDKRLSVSNITVVKYSTQNGAASSRMNSILSSDFMRKSAPYQIVSGNHSYNVVTSRNILSHDDGDRKLDAVNEIGISNILVRGGDILSNESLNFATLEVEGLLNVERINEENLKGLFLEAVYTDVRKDHFFNGNYRFSKLDVLGNIDVNSINGVDLVALDNNVVKQSGVFSLKGPVVYNNLTVIGNLNLTSVNEILWSDIIDSYTEGAIFGNYSFTSVMVSEALVSDDINSVDLDKEAVLSDKDQVIQGHIAFTKDVYVNGADGLSLANDLVNGVDVSQVEANLKSQIGTLYVTEDIDLALPLIISSDVSASSLNGIPLEGFENRFWRRSSPQNISVPVQFDNVVFSEPVYGKSINGHDVAEFLSISKDQNVSGNYNFQDHVTIDGNLNVGGSTKIDGIDLSNLASSALLIHGEQVLAGLTNGNMIMQSLYHTVILRSSKGALCPLPVGSGMVFQRRLCSLRNFASVVVDNLEIDTTLNGFSIPSDLLFLNTSKIHYDHMTFLNGTEIGTLELGAFSSNDQLSLSTLNGFDVRNAAQEIVFRNENATINGPLHFDGNMHVREFITNGKIDEIDFDDLIARSLKKTSESEQNITGSFVIYGDLLLNDQAQFNTVNNKDWRTHLNDVVFETYSGRIRGQKIFLEPLHVNNSFTPEKINNVIVLDLGSTIFTKSSDQNVTGQYQFNNNVGCRMLHCRDIGGIDTRDLLLIDSPIEIPLTEVVFKTNVTFGDGLASTTDVLSGCNITELSDVSHSIHDNKTRVFYSPLNNNHLHIEGTLTYDEEMVIGSDKTDLGHFLEDLVQKSSEDEITGKVTLMDGTKIKSLEVDFINEVEISKYLQETLIDDENITLDCSIDVTTPVTTQKLTISHSLWDEGNQDILVNGLEISHIFTNSAQPVSDNYLVHGNISFTNGFTSDSMEVSGLIDNITVTDLVTFSQTKEVTPEVTFKFPIGIAGDLQVLGDIDGVNLKDIMESRITLSSTQAVNGTFEFEEIFVEGDLEVARINGIMIEDIVTRNGRSFQKISGNKSFSQLIINGSIEAPVINEIDLKVLQHDIVRKDEDMTFNASLMFEEVVQAAALIDSEELAKRMDLNNLSDHMHSFKENFSKFDSGIQELYSHVYSLNSENYEYAKSLFMELAYIEKVNHLSLDTSGKLELVKLPDPHGAYLYLRNCSNPKCMPEEVTISHKVYNGDSVKMLPFEEIPGSRFVLSDKEVADISIIIDNKYDNHIKRAFSDVSVWKYKNFDTIQVAENKELLEGFVVDAGLFVEKQTMFLVTITHNIDFNNLERTNITTMKFDYSTNHFVTTWTKLSANIASSLDLNWINGKLFLLVANQHEVDDRIFPYRSASELYVWHSIKSEFNLTGTFIGDHVTSGMFLKSVFPVEENFFSLTQLKAADSAIYEENIHYTREVMIYQYSEKGGIFELFQFIPAYGIVDQASFTVDNNLYLLLLSEPRGALYVYEYIPIEGFHLYQEISIEGGESVTVVEQAEGKKTVVVSTKVIPGLLILDVKTKGLDPDLLI